MATDVSLSMPQPGPSGVHTPWREPYWQPRIWALATATFVLGLAYTPNFRELLTAWAEDENYQHGYLIIPIALFIFWQRLTSTELESAASAVRVPWLGWLCLAAVLVIRHIAYERNSQWLESATLLPAIACLTWTFGGWSLFRRAWPAIAFLVFMLPLPPAINNLVALPLQRMAASGSCFLLQLSGLWAIQDGNVIRLNTPHGEESLDVALACSGLRMLMTLAATVAATIFLIPLPTWKRIILLVSAVPIALLTNMLRIVTTGWCYYLIKEAVGRHRVTDWSGYLMMPEGLILVVLVLSILAWLVPESKGGNLRLMSPLNHVDQIPTKGKYLVIVAAVNNLLHFRIFDRAGKMVANSGEKALTEKVRRIEVLRKRLQRLWPPHKLTPNEKDGVITEVLTIVGCTLAGYDDDKLILLPSPKQDDKKLGDPFPEI